MASASSASSDQVRCQSLFHQTTASTPTPKWRQCLEKTIPSSKNDPKDRVMKSATHKEVASEEKPFRFLDLPPEQRNQIYKYCLDPTRGVHGWKHGNKKDFRVLLCRVGKSLYQMKVAMKGAFNPRLLRTCRTVNDEASSILYGSITFHLGVPYVGNIDHSGHLLYATAGPIKLLRRIELGRRPTLRGQGFGVHAVLDRLQNAKSLESLTADFTWIVCFRNPETMARAILKLRRCLNNARQRSGRTEVGIEFFSLNTADQHERWVGNNKALGPGKKHDPLKFIPEFNESLKRLASEEKTKKEQGKIEIA